MTHGGEDLGGLLDGGDLGPLPLLEELHTCGVVQRGGRVCAEEGGEALTVGQSRRAGAVRELKQEREKKTLRKEREENSSKRRPGFNDQQKPRDKK